MTTQEKLNQVQSALTKAPIWQYTEPKIIPFSKVDRMLHEETNHGFATTGEKLSEKIDSPLIFDASVREDKGHSIEIKSLSIFKNGVFVYEFNSADGDCFNEVYIGIAHNRCRCTAGKRAGIRFARKSKNRK